MVVWDPDKKKARIPSAFAYEILAINQPKPNLGIINHHEKVNFKKERLSDHLRFKLRANIYFRLIVNILRSNLKIV